MAWAADPPTPLDMVHFAYVIPSNRSAQASAVTNLRSTIRLINDWYRGQMYRNGFGSRTFLYETEADGVTPVVHVVPVIETDAYLRADIWGHTIDAAANAGIPVWADHNVWVLIPEIHLELSDGTIQGGVALGTGSGSGSGGGVAMIGSERLSLMTAASLIDNSTYAGRIIPAIGPYPLRQNVSFPSFEGTTISSIVSSITGAFGHEMTHGFGMPHDFRNDVNFHGNLMGNGLRGFRSTVRPDLYPTEDCRLAYAQALALSTNRFFPAAAGLAATASEEEPPPAHFWAVRSDTRGDEVPPLEAVAPTLDCFTTTPASLLPVQLALGGDETPPQVTVLTSGRVIPLNGKVVLAFTASDALGLASAMLEKDGERIAEMVLTGTSVSTSFATPYWEPVTTTYTVTVYDLSGNRTEVSTSVTPSYHVGRTQRAPRPGFLLHRSVASTNQSVTFDGSLTSDPDANSLTYEWDFNGDGVYDTPPSPSSSYTRSFATQGIYPVHLRVTDSTSAQTVSTSVPLLVVTVTK